MKDKLGRPLVPFFVPGSKNENTKHKKYGSKEFDGEVEGFISLMGNEVGAIFLQPQCHGRGAGRALMDKAQELHGNLEVEVFKVNKIGRKFYSRYGFTQLEEKLHEPTGQMLLRLKYTAAESAKPAP